MCGELWNDELKIIKAPFEAFKKNSFFYCTLNDLWSKIYLYYKFVTRVLTLKLLSEKGEYT